MNKILFLSLILLACSTHTPSPTSNRLRHGVIPLSSVPMETLDEAAVARGEALYLAHCLSCHGKSGEGDGPMAPRGTANLRQLVNEVRNFKFCSSN